MTLNTVTLTVNPSDGSNSPITQGKALFTPTSILTDAADHVLATQTPVVVTFSKNSGPPTVSLIATDNASISQAGWAWQVAFIGFPGNPQPYTFALPFAGGASQNLSDVTVVQNATTMQAYMPLPTGTPVSGQVPVAAGSGEISSWGNAALLSATGQQSLVAQRDVALTPWFAALGNRQTAKANIVCIGDSITEGQGAVQVAGYNAGFENRWIARLRDQLRMRYPSPWATNPTGGGRGYIGVNGTGVASFTWPTTITGTPAGVATGLKASGLQVTSANPGPIVYNLTGDSADILWQQVPFGGSFSWKVDAGATTNVSTNFSPTKDGQVTHISLGSAGAHTLTLQWASGNSVNLDGVIEYNGDYQTGIGVLDGGHFGWLTSNWLTPSSQAPGQCIAAVQPGLIIITLGVNDQFSNVVPATFQANLQTIITNLKAQLTAPYPSFVLNMVPPRSGQGGYTYPWSQYLTAAYAVAAADTSGPAGQSLVTVMDFTVGPRLPGADTDAYGYWHAGDLVHPSNKGHQLMADALIEFLKVT